jgi:thioesterase domain-containing protein
VYASPTSLYDMLDQLRPQRETAAADAKAGALAAAQAAADPPRDDVERRLAEMWTSLLGVREVGIRDNFFELGGHSLIAVRLFARIKKVYGVDLPLAVLFQAPTIETCAELLRKELGIAFAADSGAAGGSSPRASAPDASSETRKFAHVVSIQKGNGRVPFFCVHGAGGNVLNFRELARHLGKDQPFFGLQAQGVDGAEPASSIDEMAEQYHREIVEVQPHGPYLLGGYSGGGVIAYELAQRLTAAGEEVRLLVFLDTFHPSTTARKLTLRERMTRIMEEGPGYLSKGVKAKLSRHVDQLSTDLKLMLLAANDLPLPLELRELKLARAFLQAASRYHPRPYAGEVLLFRARLIDEIYRHMGPTLGWAELVPRLKIVEVPGGHDSLVLEPNVQVLSGHLAGAIARATGA